MPNNVKEIAKHPTLWASMIGFINPATAAPIVAIGIITWATIKIFKKDENKKEPLLKAVKSLNQPLPDGSPTVKATVHEPLNNDEKIKKEMLRQVMSELGKRSAKARARKREGGAFRPH